ncbi:MAG: S8 family serine peptidase [Pseudobdellovibrio sp.]
MKLASLIASLLLLASFAQAKDRYLVQFKSEQGFKAMEAYFTTTESAAPNMQKSLANLQILILKTKNVNLINSLKNHPEVESVEPERFFPAPKPVNGFKMAQRVQYFERSFKPAQPSSPDLSGVPNFQQGPSTPWGILAVHAGDAWALSGAGQNSRVMVLDTGIDAQHPAIAPNFEKGRNFTENSSGQTVDTDYADGEGHGTHCSGTILGAYNEATGFTGVAPKAKLLMGRVCGTDGCSNIAIVDGLNWAISEKVDVVSMSLGGPVGTAPEKSAIAKAEKAGIVVVAASGNGADDPNYSPNKNDPKCGTNPMQGNSCGVSFPGAYPTVVSVGALNSSLVKTSFSQWGPELVITAPGAAVISSVPRGTGRDSKVEITIAGVKTLVNSAAFGGTELFTTPAVNTLVSVPGVGNPEDFAKVDVAGKFALVSRGQIKFADKVKNAIDAKAAGVIIYNNAAGLMQGSLSEDGTLINLPVVMVEQTEGQAIVAALQNGSAVSAAVSTLPADYASFDGTSMATPHVAGVVALIRSANKKLTPAQVRAVLTSTAKPLAPNDTNQYGAGLVQADAAVRKAVGQ